MSEARVFLAPALAVATLLALPIAAHAGRADVFIGPDVTYLHYREFDRNDRELDRETGALPGLRFAIRSTQDRLFARIGGTWHDGRIDYDGETQSGQPVESDSDARLANVSADIGYWFDGKPYNWGTYLHLARHGWDRDVRASSTAGGTRVQGISEQYRWTEVGLGLRYAGASVDSGWRHEVTATVLRVTDASIHVDLSDLNSAYDDASLDLGDRFGARLRYTASRIIGDYTLRIQPYAAYWAFGRSDTEPVTAGGSPSGIAVTEPSSKSVRVGLAVGVAFKGP